MSYQTDWEAQCKILENKLDQAVSLIDQAYKQLKFAEDCADYHPTINTNWLAKARELGAGGE